MVVKRTAPMLARMGCKGSRQGTITEQKQAVQVNPMPKLSSSELEVDILRSTWPIVSRDIWDTGMRLMLDVFAAEPNIKRIFKSFSSMTVNELERNEAFRLHGVRFMHVIGSFIDGIDDVDDHNEALFLLGAKHAAIAEFDIQYFGIFTKSLHQTWEHVLGEEYTDDVREIWLKVFEFIVLRMRDGYYMFLDDRKRSETCDKRVDTSS